MPNPANADETCSVRLPAGVKAEIVAATGQPFSRTVRFMCMSLLARYREQRAAGERPADARQALAEDISTLPTPPAE